MDGDAERRRSRHGALRHHGDRLPVGGAHPRLPGPREFKGKVYHTGHWPHEGVDFTGKRVARHRHRLLGDPGIPVIAEEAAHLVVFQRTPNFTIPARNAPLSDDVKRRWKANYAELPTPGSRGVAHRHRARAGAPRARSKLTRGGAAAANTRSAGPTAASPSWRPTTTSSSTRRPTTRRPTSCASKIGEIVQGPGGGADPAAAQPSDRHQAHLRRHRLLRDFQPRQCQPRRRAPSPIEEVVPKAFAPAASVYELDAIVFATGFDAMTGALDGIDIRGPGRGGAARTNGRAARSTYLGLMAAGFPNLFMITGPGSPSVLSNMIVSIEQHVDWIADCLGAYARDAASRHRGDASGARTGWVAHVNEVAQQDALSARQFLVHGRQHPRQAARLHALYRRRRRLPPASATTSPPRATRVSRSPGRSRPPRRNSHANVAVAVAAMVPSGVTVHSSHDFSPVGRPTSVNGAVSNSGARARW